MIYRQACGDELSLLGFGAMRLPQNADGSIDVHQVAEMTRLAIEGGVNYFDTAYPYHAGLSEVVMGRVLKDYKRDSFYLATKFPGHQIRKDYNPETVFEEQLEKCGVDYFDYYLLHNVYEKSIDVYNDPQWGIIDYFLEQKRKGRIRHLGFSTHGGLELMNRFLDKHESEMEFCQIQLNYLDWRMQDASKKYEMLTQRGIPVWVMEPVRGGRLASLGAAESAALKALRPNESVAAWSFRFLQALPNVKMILSGMSNIEQMVDNIKTFESDKPLQANERELILSIADSMHKLVPCTACRYCCDGCPAGLDIPSLLTFYNDMSFQPSVNIGMRLEVLPDDKKPSACLGCGKCEKACPQGIEIPKLLNKLAESMKSLPTWAEVCRQRDEAAEKNKGKTQ